MYNNSAIIIRRCDPGLRSNQHIHTRINIKFGRVNCEALTLTIETRATTDEVLIHSNYVNETNNIIIQLTSIKGKTELTMVIRPSLSML